MDGVTGRRSIHGVVAYSRGETFFANSHDASETGKNAKVLAAEWASTLEMVGAAEHVMAMCMDGEASNRAAGVILNAS